MYNLGHQSDVLPETALGGLCEVTYVSGQPRLPVSGQGYIKTYNNNSNSHLKDVQLCPRFLQLLRILRNLRMIEVLLHGNLKKKVMENIPNASSILICDYVEGEHFQELLGRLGLNLEIVGNCYINTNPAEPDSVLHDHDTIELNQ